MKENIPKLRAWGKTTRKVMTMIIPTKKDRLKQRNKQKELIRKIIEKELK
jgi:hypothetical protein